MIVFLLLTFANTISCFIAMCRKPSDISVPPTIYIFDIKMPIYVQYSKLTLIFAMK